MEEEITPLVSTSHKPMPLWEIFTFLKACKFDPRKQGCFISHSGGYITISSRN